MDFYEVVFMCINLGFLIQILGIISAAIENK